MLSHLRVVFLSTYPHVLEVSARQHFQYIVSVKNGPVSYEYSNTSNLTEKFKRDWHLLNLVSLFLR